MGNLFIAEDIIHLNQSLRLNIPLPDGIRVMNPFLLSSVNKMWQCGEKNLRSFLVEYFINY